MALIAGQREGAREGWAGAEGVAGGFLDRGAQWGGLRTVWIRREHLRSGTMLQVVLHDLLTQTGWKKRKATFEAFIIKG